MHETRNTPLNKGDPACWTPSKSTFDVSSITPTSSTCLDCVQPGYALSEITSLCTDKCVVIACNNPDHGDISCHRAGGNPHCDLVCDGATNCNDCTGFDEFVCTLLIYKYLVLIGMSSCSVVLTTTRASPNHRVRPLRGILSSITFYALVAKKGRGLLRWHMCLLILLPQQKWT